MAEEEEEQKKKKKEDEKGDRERESGRDSVASENAGLVEREKRESV